MKNSTKLLAAAALGVVAGGVLGLLFAPDKGNETRKKISKRSKKLMSSIKTEFNKEKLARLKEKLENKLQHISTKLEDLSKHSQNA